jgi:hypothetical protein
MMGSSGGWSSPRGHEEAAMARDSSSTGVLRWLGYDERQTGMQEGSCTADSTWRERERAKKELATQRRGLPFKSAEKEMGRGVPAGGAVAAITGEGGGRG